MGRFGVASCDLELSTGPSRSACWSCALVRMRWMLASQRHRAVKLSGLFLTGAKPTRCTSLNPRPQYQVTAGGNGQLLHSAALAGGSNATAVGSGGRVTASRFRAAEGRAGRSALDAQVCSGMDRVAARIIRVSYSSANNIGRLPYVPGLVPGTGRGAANRTDWAAAGGEIRTLTVRGTRPPQSRQRADPLLCCGSRRGLWSRARLALWFVVLSGA